MSETINEKMHEKLTEWCSQMMTYHLPRWNELPEIDIYMDQVVVLMEKYLSMFDEDASKIITPSIINNYVKQELIPPPIKKKYTRTHIAYLMMICILKQVLPLSSVMCVIEYETERMSVEEVYDKFCDEQEESILSVIRQVSNVSESDPMVENFILRAAIAANSSKAVTEKIMDLRDGLLIEEEEAEK